MTIRSGSRGERNTPKTPKLIKHGNKNDVNLNNLFQKHRFENQKSSNEYDIQIDDSISQLGANSIEITTPGSAMKYRCKNIFTVKLDWIKVNEQSYGFITCPNIQCQFKLGIFSFDGLKC